MAEPSVTPASPTGSQDADTRPTALLIGSYKFEKSRPVRYMHHGTRIVDKVHGKGGRKRVFTKKGEVLPEAWVMGDLQNMERFVEMNEMHWYGTLDYREHDAITGEYADGKRLILNVVSAFFAQDDRSEFILYFSGHGDKNGSWCIPVTERKHIRQPSVDDGNEASNAVISRSPCKTVEVEADRADDEENSIKRRRTPSPVPKPQRARSGTQSSFTASLHSRASRASTRSDVPPTNLFFDLVSYDDIVDIWDEEKKGRQRKLMMILDCCHSGRWVQMVNGECRRLGPDELQGPLPPLSGSTESLAGNGDMADGGNDEEEGAGAPPESDAEIEGEITVTEEQAPERTETENQTHKHERQETEGQAQDDERQFYERRTDICIQAACHPVEESMIAKNQLSSFFTRLFIAAQTKKTFEKFCITFFDHFFVLGLPSLFYSHSFTPMKSAEPPFHRILFFDSFDDMHLQTT